MYKSDKSSTFKANGTAFFIGYEDGDEVVGSLAQDTIRIGAMTIKNQTFAQATSFPTKQIYDGILGLGFVSNANSRASTVLDNLFDQKQISEKVFSFYLNRYIYMDPIQIKTQGLFKNSFICLFKRDLHDMTYGGEITFGGIDPSFYTGNVYYVPLSIKTDWQFKMEK